MGSTPIPGSNTEPLYSIPSFLWHLKKEGLKETTITENYAKVLKNLERNCNIGNPDSVLGHLASKEVCEGRKELIVDVYARFCKWANIPFKEAKPTRDEIDDVRKLEELLNEFEELRVDYFMATQVELKIKIEGMDTPIINFKRVRHYFVIEPIKVSLKEWIIKLPNFYPQVIRTEAEDFVEMVSGLLEGKNVDLRVRERDDIDFLAEWFNDVDFLGEYNPIVEQISKSERIRLFDNPSNLAILTEFKLFIVQKKDGTKIGIISHRLNLPQKWMEISYSFVPSERGKGYGTEAAQLMVDYLFLSKEIARIHAFTDVRNKASQRVLEKAGFHREGTIRKCIFDKGELRDYYLYSILREEWKEPKILTKTPSKSKHK